ncbi:MAG TPA: hypothetical protein P5256_03400 [Beijerinckiaceae bacterium]|nr:hypothetical protein [Rhizobiaceae bacterium]MCB9999489.1 hypothetical protein [Methylobacteriaceae bacterium]HRY02144.1 hypothetical protein [Beijerinckiaceae bacterium]
MVEESPSKLQKADKSLAAAAGIGTSLAKIAAIFAVVGTVLTAAWLHGPSYVAQKLCEADDMATVGRVVICGLFPPAPTNRQLPKPHPTPGPTIQEAPNEKPSEPAKPHVQQSTPAGAQLAPEAAAAAVHPPSIRSDGCIDLSGAASGPARVEVGTRLCSVNDQVVITAIDSNSIAYSLNGGYATWCKVGRQCGFDFDNIFRFRVRIVGASSSEKAVADLLPE